MTSETILHFRDEHAYQVAVDVIAGYKHSDPVNDLRECSDGTSPFTVSLGAALDAVREARKGRKQKPPPRRRPRWLMRPKGGDAA